MCALSARIFLTLCEGSKRVSELGWPGSGNLSLQEAENETSSFKLAHLWDTSSYPLACGRRLGFISWPNAMVWRLPTAHVRQLLETAILRRRLEGPGRLQTEQNSEQRDIVSVTGYSQYPSTVKG